MKLPILWTATTSLRKGTCAVFFDQRTLMAGLGQQGTKTTKIEPRG